MAKLTKKQKALQGKVDSNKLYSFADAVALVKEAATAKFDESIDVAVQLGVDAKKSDQVVRGAWFCLTAPARLLAWLCSHKAPRLKKPRLPALTWSAWTTWLLKSRPATCPSTW